MIAHSGLELDLLLIKARVLLLGPLQPPELQNAGNLEITTRACPWHTFVE